MKIKKSISKQLFIITSLLFIVFIIIILITQTLFFQKFYVNKKRRDIQSVVSKFKEEYKKTNTNEETKNLIEKYHMNNNVDISILESSGNIQMYLRREYLKPEKIKTMYMNEFINNWVPNIYKFQEIMTKNKSDIYLETLKEKEVPRKNIVCIWPIKEKNQIIFGFDSLEPVNEAVSVIKEFYLYFFVVAILLIIVTSLIYSNIITKPLVQINKTALKMAELDFNERCTVKSENEIGSLATTLNFLSYNLQKALTSLKEANAKLEEDIEKERQLEKMRREFVAAVSHELKTPITLIEGYAEGIKDNVFDDEDKDYYIDVIMDESKKMTGLINDMLDLSLLECGNFKLVKEKFFIDQLIKSNIKRFWGIVKEKNINIQTNLIDNIEVDADWNRIEQVIYNILTNAVKYTGDKCTIFVNMVRLNKKIKIEIENEGEHIEKEELEKIWDKFYKVDKSRSRKLGGTGIGLAVVKNIIVLHGGECGVENTERGVKFYFILPL